MSGVANNDVVVTEYGEISKHSPLSGSLPLSRFGKNVSRHIENAVILAYGSYSVVFSVNNARKVVKVHTTKQKLDNEEKVLRDLDHPNIIKLYSRITIGEYAGLELERCDIDFLEIIKSVKLDDSQVASIGRTVALSLQYLHINNVAYLDLKPDNILLSISGSGDERKETIKLCDFEYAHRFASDEERINFDKGTPQYAAPEIYLAQYYRYEPDIWSFGATLYTLSRRTTLFSYDMSLIAFKICNYRGEKLKDSLIDKCIRSCLFNLRVRPTIADILKHPFLSQE